MGVWHFAGAFLAFLLGAWAFAIGYRSLRMVRALSYRVTPIESLTPGTRPTIEGEIQPVGDPEPSVLTETPGTVLSYWHFKLRDESGDRNRWRHVQGIHGRPFYVDDGTDRVRIEVGETDRGGDDIVSLIEDPGSGDDSVEEGGAIVQFDGKGDPLEVVEGDVTAEQLAVFERRMELPEAPNTINLVDIGHQHGDRYYYERVLEPGDTVCVAGRVAETDDGSLVLTTPQDVPQVVSEMRASRLYLRALASAVLLPVGVGLFVGGLHLLTLW